MANNSNRHGIDIHRNAIEQYLMKCRDFIKRKNMSFWYVTCGVIFTFVMAVTIFVYIDGFLTDSRIKFEIIVEDYQSDPMNKNVQDKAIKDLNALIEETSFGFANRMSFYVLGNIYFDRKDFKNSIKMFNRFTKKSSSDDLFIPIAQNKVAICLEETGDIDGALELFLQIEADSGESVIMDQVIYNLGRLYFLKGDKVKAKEYFERVLITYPDSYFSKRAKERLFLLSSK